MNYADTARHIRKIPAAAITVEDAELLQRMQDRGEQVTVKLTMGARTLPKTVAISVAVAMSGAGSPLASYAQERSIAHIHAVADAIRDPRLKALFLNRPMIANVLSGGGRGARGTTA